MTAETTAQAGAEAAFRISAIELCQKSVARRNAQVEHERAVAIYDLLESNSFTPLGCPPGPYKVQLSLQENRLIFEIFDEGDALLNTVPLPMLPFKKIVKEYFLVCESYYDAIKTAAPTRIEAIDMGRRGLHNEGSVMLQERLAGHIEMDHDTARRLFTLLCVLHIRG